MKSGGWKSLPSSSAPDAHHPAKKHKLDSEWTVEGLGVHAAELDIAKLCKADAGKRLEPGCQSVNQLADNQMMTLGGEFLEYALPEVCSHGVLCMVILEHRKAEENAKDMESVTYTGSKGSFIDSKGSYTRVEMRVAGTDGWHTYLSFGHPQKFAEPRSKNNPEGVPITPLVLSRCPLQPDCSQ